MRATGLAEQPDDFRDLLQHLVARATMHHRDKVVGPVRPPPMPANLWDLPCGAKTRAGTPCKITTLYFGGRYTRRRGIRKFFPTAMGVESAIDPPEHLSVSSSNRAAKAIVQRGSHSTHRL